MPTTIAAKATEPTETPTLRAVLCVSLCGTPTGGTAEAVDELEPEVDAIPDGAIFVMIVGCKVTVKTL